MKNPTTYNEYIAWFNARKLIQYYAISQESVDKVREFMEKNPQGSVVGDSTGITLKASGGHRRK